MKKIALLLIPCFLLSETMFIKEDANIRISPDANSEIVGVYKRHAPIAVIGSVYSKQSKTKWYQTKDGYVYGGLVQGFERRLNEVKKENPNEYEKIVSTQKEKEIVLVHCMKAIETKVEKEEIVLENTIPDEMILEKSIEKVEDNNIQKEPNNDRKWFVSSMIGFGKIASKYSNINGSFYSIQKEDTTGLNFGLDLGYKYTQNLFIASEYQRMSTDDITLDNLLLNINYQFDMSFNPFVGMVAGVSYIKVNSSPVSGLNGVDTTGKSNIFGIQAGGEKKIEENIFLLAKYQYLSMKHTTILESGITQAKIERDTLNNFQIGLKYYFK